jgi:cation diffusion facilitator family transporter
MATKLGATVTTELNGQQTKFQMTRFKGIKKVLWVTLFLNLLVAAIKIVVGILVWNLTVLSDGFHSLLDGANNVIGILAMGVASRPADEDHPYGHHKFEHVAALILAGLIFLLCYEMIKKSFNMLWAGEQTFESLVDPGAWWQFALIGFCMLINLGVSFYEKKEGNRLDSTLLRADARHTMSDSMVTFVSLISLLFSRLVWWLDPLFAIGVAGFLFYAATAILRENIPTMTDQIRLDPMEIQSVVESIEGVGNAHAIRSHGMENDIHLDLHIQVKDFLDAQQVMGIESDVRKKLQLVFPQVTLISIQHETNKEEEEKPIWRP